MVTAPSHAPTLAQMHYKHKKKAKKQTLPKEHNDFPVTGPKEREISDLCEKEFKTIILRKFREIQGNTDRQLNELRKTM